MLKGSKQAPSPSSWCVGVVVGGPASTCGAAFPLKGCSEGSFDQFTITRASIDRDFLSWQHQAPFAILYSVAVPNYTYTTPIAVPSSTCTTFAEEGCRFTDLLHANFPSCSAFTSAWTTAQGYARGQPEFGPLAHSPTLAGKKPPRDPNRRADPDEVDRPQPRQKLQKTIMKT